MRRALLAVLSIAAMPWAGSIYAATCTREEGYSQDELQQLLGDRFAQAKKAVLNVAVDQPSTTPVTKQLSAPATSGVSPDLVNGPAFTSLVAMAVDAGLISQSTGATTLDLNFFAFVAGLNPRVVQEQEQYARFTTLRRLSGSITLGGKGDAFDQDGDGTIDDAKTADKSTDIITWDMRYRLIGSRDRRDRQNYRRLFAVPTASADAQITNLLLEYNRLHPDETVVFCKSGVDAFLSDPNNRARAQAFASADQTARSQYDKIAAEIDQSFLLTLAFGGTERKGTTFGPDKRLVGLRASWAALDATFDANLDYAKTMAFHGAPDARSTKFGLAYNNIYLKGLVGFENRGITFALSAAWEKYRNVPQAAHDDIGRANIKLTYPISATVNLPFSITWANHTDLLNGEKEIRGNIGFTYDLDPLFKPTKD